MTNYPTYKFPQAPKPVEPPVVKPNPCCAKCRRGSKAHGLFPCGLKYACPCHDRKENS